MINTTYEESSRYIHFIISQIIMPSSVIITIYLIYQLIKLGSQNIRESVQYYKHQVNWEILIFKRQFLDSIRFWGRDWFRSTNIYEFARINQVARILLSTWQLLQHKQIPLVERIMRLILDFNIDTVVAQQLLGAVGSQPECRDDRQIEAQAGLSFVLPSIFVSTLGYIITGKQVASNKVSLMSKKGASLFVELGKIGNATVGVERLFEKLAAYTDYLMDMFFGIKSPEYMAFSKLDQLCVGVSTWAAEVTGLSLSKEIRLQITNDKAIRTKVLRLKEQAMNFTKELKGNILARPYMEVFNRAIITVKELGLHAEVCQRNTQRFIEPYVLSFYGEAGIGKSFLLNDLVKRTVRDLKFDVGTNQPSYTRNGADQYWSGYSGQFATIYDDFSQFMDTADNTTLKEFIDIVSPKETMVNMADLADKGLRFTSSLVILTDNQGWPKMDTMRHQDAFRRRRNLLVKVRHVDNRRFDSIDDVSNVACEHLRFEIMDPMAEGRSKNGEEMEYKQFYPLFLKSFGPHLKRMESETFDLLPLEEESTIEGQSGETEIIVPTFAERTTWTLIATEQANDELIKSITHIPVWERQLEIIKSFPDSEERYKEKYQEFLENTLVEEIQTIRDQLKGKMIKMRDVFIDPANKKVFIIITALLGSATAIYFFYKYMRKGKPEDLTVDDQGSNESGDYRTKWATKRVVMTRPLKQQDPNKFYSAQDQMTYVEEKNLMKQEKLHNKMIRIMIQAGTDQRHINTITKNFQKMKNAYVEAQMGDQALEEIIRHSILPSLCVITDPLGRTINALQLYSYTFMIPHHYAAALTDDDTLEIAFAGGAKPCHVSFRTHLSHRMRDRDICLVSFGSRVKPGKDIRKHFATDNDLGKKLRDQPIEIINMQEKYIVYRYALTADLKTMTKTDPQALKYFSTNQYQLATFWEYFYPSRKGFCGSLIVNSAKGAQRRILGFHVAGTKNDTIGWAEPVTREMIDEAILEAKFLQPSIIIESQFGFDQYKVLDREEVKRVPIQPPDCFDVVGFAPATQSIQMPTKTDIRKTLLHDLVYTHTSEPAVLDPKDERMLVAKSSLFVNGFDKYARSTKPFPAWVHDNVILSLRDDCLLMKDINGRQVRTREEAINGVYSDKETGERFDYLDHINFDSSPGYPYVFERPQGAHGKHFLFEEKDNYRTIIHGGLDKRITERIEQGEQGQRIFSPWVDQIKDERRSLAKVAAGETRTFCMAPVDYVITFRMYFMDFCAAFYNSHVDSFHTVGIDAESPTWTRMYNKLVEVGDTGFAGDYKQFDGIAHNDAQLAFCAIVNDWYGDKPGSANAMMREVLCSEGAYTLSLVGNCFYYVPQGVNSGNPATVIIDSFVNQYYLRCAFRMIMSEENPSICSMDDYRKYVRSFSNGDDNINMVNVKIQQYYNIRTVAAALSDFGVIYTSADKTQDMSKVAPIEHISEMTFLKRAFVPHETYNNLMKAPIDKKTIQELVNWIREGQDHEEAMYENLRTSLHFAYHWGTQYYDTHLGKINIALQQLGKPSLTKPYLDHDQMWLDQFRG